MTTDDTPRGRVRMFRAHAINLALSVIRDFGPVTPTIG